MTTWKGGHNLCIYSAINYKKTSDIRLNTINPVLTQFYPPDVEVYYAELTMWLSVYASEHISNQACHHILAAQSDLC